MYVIFTNDRDSMVSWLGFNMFSDDDTYFQAYYFKVVHNLTNIFITHNITSSFIMLK